MPPDGTNRRLSLLATRSTLRERLLEILPDAVCPSRTPARLYFLQSKKLSRTTAPSRISRKVLAGRDYFSLMHLSRSLSSVEFRKRLLFFLSLGFSRRDLSNQPIDRSRSDTAFDKVCRRRYLGSSLMDVPLLPRGPVVPPSVKCPAISPTPLSESWYTATAWTGDSS